MENEVLPPFYVGGRMQPSLPKPPICYSVVFNFNK